MGTLPSALLQALCLEFKGVAADLLFLKTMTFTGHNIGYNLSTEQEDWQLIYHALDKITDLDPRFWDPYVFAEMIFAWQTKKFDKVNSLLEKAAQARPDDYRPLYYLGFNHFYFSKKTSKAAPYLREAAIRPNAPSFIQGLASRMSLYGSQTIAGIVFLEELLENTFDPVAKQQFETRLTALKRIHLLEKAVLKYKKAYQQQPESLEELINKQCINEIPTDPYGGKFVLLNNGRIYTTSELIHKKNKNNGKSK